MSSNTMSSVKRNDLEKAKKSYEIRHKVLPYPYKDIKPKVIRSKKTPSDLSVKRKASQKGKNQRQEQTVIVNIHKGKRGGGGIEKPKPKDNPKDNPKDKPQYPVGFSVPVQNPITEYLKLFGRDLLSKIQTNKKDAVVGSLNEVVEPIISVKSPIDSSPTSQTLYNFLKTQKELTENLSGSTRRAPSEEVSPEELTQETVDSLTSPPEPPDLEDIDEPLTRPRRGRGPDRLPRKPRSNSSTK